MDIEYLTGQIEGKLKGQSYDASFLQEAAGVSSCLESVSQERDGLPTVLESGDGVFTQKQMKFLRCACCANEGSSRVSLIPESDLEVREGDALSEEWRVQ